MLIRVSGGRDGIKEYLENGNKQGREHSRDELDHRLLLTGNLELTNDIIQGMANDGEKYLHITLSFKEDQINDDLLRTITEEFKKYAMNAFGDDEFNFYAEAHLPKIKSYIDKKTGEDVQRKPHIHIVIPKQNLLSGRIIDPLGEYEKNVDFFRAFQEKINQQHGLASPARNKRQNFMSVADIISRYKGDSFSGNAKETKSLLHKMILEKDISTWDDFKKVASNFGEIKIRNEGRSNEYVNLKLPSATKGINLKDSVFSRESIEKKGIDPVWIEQQISQWKDVRSFELKHIVKASDKIRTHYYSLNNAEKKDFLLSREFQFNNKFREAINERHIRESIRGNISGGRQPERAECIQPRKLHLSSNIRGIQQRHSYSITTRTPAPAARSLRSLSEFGVVREERRDMLLLPRNDAAVLEKRGTGGHLYVRRGISGVEQKKTPLRGRRSSLPKKPREPQLTPLAAAPVLARMKAGKITQIYSAPAVVPVQNKTPLKMTSVQFRGHLTSLRDVAMTGKEVVPVIARASLQPASFRVHSMISAMVEKQKEQQLKTSQGKLSFYKELRLELDATRLLNRLSQTHGLLVDKYQVVVGNDGSDRISAGSRNYNVSDFLTKEMNMPWQEASKILSSVYKAQQQEEPRELPQHARHRVLWEAHREQYDVVKSEAWKQQLASERERRDVLKERLKVELGNLKSLARNERTTARSITRMAHVARQVSLNTVINQERQELKKKFANPLHHFRDFLVKEAQEGNIDALVELRRHREKEQVPDSHSVGGEEREPQLHEALNYRVARNGDVTYLANGQQLFTDRGWVVSFSDPKEGRFEREQIELGLRLSLAKFGGVLELTGSDEFKKMVVEVAAQNGMKVDFKDVGLNTYLELQREALNAGKAAFTKDKTEVEKASGTPEQEKERQEPTVEKNSSSRGIDINIDIDPDD